MPEIHVHEEELDAEEVARAKEVASIGRTIEELAKIAAFGAWLARQSPLVQELAREWASKGSGRDPRFRFGKYVAPRSGRTVYVCASESGYHESHQGHEHALFLMVDAHRTRVEDLESTHARLAKIPARARTEEHRRLVDSADVMVREGAARAGRKLDLAEASDAANVRGSRALAREIARRVLEANPRMPGEQRDALVLAEVARLEALPEIPAPPPSPPRERP